MSKRVYLDDNLELNKEIELPKEAVHYLKNVLRINKNDKLCLFNGDGYEYLSEIINLDKRNIKILIKSKEKNDKENDLYIHLALSVIKSDKMDFAIQKSIELGVKEITPVYSKRCQINFKNKIENKMLHWKKIIISSCEQSGRSFIPKLNTILNFDEALKLKSENKLLLSPYAKQGISEISSSKSYLTLVGPEGGFTEEEEKKAVDNGFNTYKMGALIMRAETAPIVICSVIYSNNKIF